MSQIEQGRQFVAEFEHGGVDIRRVGSDLSVAFLQGDEANELQDDLERIATFTYPRGPVADVEQMIDLILGEYA